MFVYNANEDLEELMRRKASFWLYDDVGGIQAWLEFVADIYCPMHFEMYPRDGHVCPVLVASKMFDVRDAEISSNTSDSQLEATALPFAISITGSYVTYEVRPVASKTRYER